MYSHAKKKSLYLSTCLFSTRSGSYRNHLSLLLCFIKQQASHEDPYHLLSLTAPIFLFHSNLLQSCYNHIVYHKSDSCYAIGLGEWFSSLNAQLVMRESGSMSIQILNTKPEDLPILGEPELPTPGTLW
jgi:hypothetical protein